MREHQIEVNGINLQVHEYAHEGDVIVFTHFGGGNLMMWEGVLPYFKDRYHLITLDMRGHGKSDSPQTGYHIDQMAADVAGMMGQLDVQKAHIVGSSLGAEVGLSLATNHPDKVVSLVCEGALYSEFGPYGINDETEAEFEKRVERTLEQIRGMTDEVYSTPDELMTALQKMYQENNWWHPGMEAMLRHSICEVDGGGYTKTWRSWARTGYMEHYYDYRFEDYYRRVRCPILMLPDEEEIQNERYRAAILGFSKLVEFCQIVEVPGWSHPYGWIFDPGPVSEAVLAFLDDVSSKKWNG